MTNSFSNQCMLMSLNVRSFGGRREDKKVSEDVAKQAGAKSDAGKYTKNLVPKKALEPITLATGAMRRFFYENTLPWLDSGVRILTAKNYDNVKAKLAALRDDYDTAVNVFCRDFPKYQEEAKRELGSLYDPNDYPSNVRDAFDVRVKFMPVADPADFRVMVADSERVELQRQIAETMQAAQDEAMRDIWARVSECVNHMADRLRAYKVVAGKAENHFRDSLVENLRDLCELIPRLNFQNDPRLESIRKEIEAELLRVQAQDLRDDFRVRENVAKKAEEIAARVAEFMA